MVPMVEAADKIQQQINKGKVLYERNLTTQQEVYESKMNYRRWDDYNNQLLKYLFNTPTESIRYVYQSSFYILELDRESISLDAINDHKKYIKEKIHRLESLHDRLELIPLALPLDSNLPSPANKKPGNSKVFVVHGHDDISKNELEIFLRSIGLEPIVLHRQADEGLTIIEKFEKHSDVGYAFILLTPDEVAYLRSEDAKPDDERKKELRARPNVIFEFGYFVGKLGRSRVCCLHTGDVSLPSDVSGMIYKRYQSNIEETGVSIMRDLKNCGIRYKA